MKKMTIFEYGSCDDDYFKDHLFSRSHLIAWLDSKGLVMPVDERLSDFTFLQVSTLLSEIQSSSNSSLSVEKAFQLAHADHGINENFYKPASRLFMSFKIAGLWRNLFIKGVTEGELVLLEYGSKLPLRERVSLPVLIKETERKFGVQENPVGHEWRAKAWAMAKDIHAKNLERGWGFDKESVAREIEEMFSSNQLNLKTKTGKPIDRKYIVRHALTGWSECFGVKEKKKTR